MASTIEIKGFLVEVDGDRVSIIHPSQRGCVIVFEVNSDRLRQGYIGSIQWTLKDLSLDTQPTQFREE